MGAWGLFMVQGVRENVLQEKRVTSSTPVPVHVGPIPRRTTKKVQDLCP